MQGGRDHLLLEGNRDTLWFIFLTLPFILFIFGMLDSVRFGFASENALANAPLIAACRGDVVTFCSKVIDLFMYSNRVPLFSEGL